MRATILAVALLLRLAPAAGASDLTELKAAFDKIVRASAGTVGVTLVHVESGAQISIRGDERFPMASVYKLPIAVELLAQVAQGRLTLDREVILGPSDIRACCTLSRRHPRGGVTMTAGELLELMMVESDNTSGRCRAEAGRRSADGAAPSSSLGYEAMSVDRYEGDINFEMTGVQNLPPQDQWTLDMQYRIISEVSPQALQQARARYVNDPRDTATPDEMAKFLAELQAGALLPRSATAQLLDLMTRAKTGAARLKGLLPADTRVAHKTGTTDVVTNDVGIITLPDDSAIPGHIALAVFATNGRVRAMQATIAKLSGAALNSSPGSLCRSR